MTRWIITLCSLAAALFLMCPAAPAGDGKLVFVRSGNVWIANTDGTAPQPLTSFEPGKHSLLSPALSPDGQWVAFSLLQKGRAKQLYRVPSRGGAVEPLRPKGMWAAWSPSFAPDGKSLLFVGMSQYREDKKYGPDLSYATVSISLMDLKDKRVRHIVKTPDHSLNAGENYAHPAFSPDGRRIAYQHSGSDVSGGFWVINLQGRTLFKFPADPQNSDPYWRPQFSPDGKEILCYTPPTSARDGAILPQGNNIFLVNLATGQARGITPGWNPTFVDGGKAIVYEGWSPDAWNKGFKSDLWRLDLSPGAQPRKILTDGAEPAGQP